MVYALFTSLIRKHLYIIHHERLTTQGGALVLDRYVAKHPNLRPELIVINDQPHGFKGPDQENATLEDFPIYLEVEMTKSPDGEELLESVDLYSETSHSCRNRLSDVIYLANVFEQTVILDRLRRVNDPAHETTIIYSRYNDLLMEDYLENELSNSTDHQELSALFAMYFNSFTTFVKLLHDVIVREKPVDKLSHFVNPPPKQE